jgi:hypothetical protein
MLPDAAGTVTSTLPLQSSPGLSSHNPPSAVAVNQIDRGVLVSRDAISHKSDRAIRASLPEILSNTEPRSDARGQHKNDSETNKKSKKKKKKPGDELSSLFGSLS